ncbi:MAG: hypothetical protein JRN21_03000 [Nitrososphaerota archaeon]|nr:hypothetical protein [Nitrososphaerota archaeon]
MSPDSRDGASSGSVSPEPPVRVARLLKTLGAARQFLKAMSPNSADELRQLDFLIRTLRPYSGLTLDKLADMLDTARKASRSPNSQIGNVSLSQLMDPILRGQLGREALASAAQRELGISKWRLLKADRNQMDEIIENAIENRRTLDTIARRASSK